MTFYANATEFLRAVEARYRALESYADNGVVQSATQRQRFCDFQTAWRRPTLFRFTFSSPHPYRPLGHLRTDTVIGSDGQAPYFYKKWYGDDEDIDRPESLMLAIAGATGISRGASHTIGVLLIAEMEGFRLLDLQRIRFRRTRVIDGVPCIAVSGMHRWGAGRYTAWFGAQDLLLRRLFRHKRGTEELRFNIRVDHPVPDDVFHAPELRYD